MTGEQKETIRRLRKAGFSYAVIGNKLGISKETVKSFCRRNGLTVSKNNSTDSSDRCRECGKSITQKEKQKKRIFCSKECREKWWKEHPDKIKRRAVYSFTCNYCGRAFSAYGNRHRKYCCHACYIADRFGGGVVHE